MRSATDEILDAWPVHVSVARSLGSEHNIYKLASYIWLLAGGTQFDLDRWNRGKSLPYNSGYFISLGGQMLYAVRDVVQRLECISQAEWTQDLLALLC